MEATAAPEGRRKGQRQAHWWDWGGPLWGRLRHRHSHRLHGLPRRHQGQHRRGVL